MVVFAAGCSERGSNSPPLEQAPGPAVYGAPQGVPSTTIPRARPSAKDESWKIAPFSFVQTELSPATLFHSSGNYLGFFTGLKEFGLGAPAYVAFSTPVGPRVFKNGEPMDGSRMEESWVLVWFAGAKGWTNWDSPWVIYLQKKPKSMKLDADGLHFEFPQAAGDVVLLSLYGYYKPPQEGKEFLAAHKLPAKKLKTWEWAKVLPKEPLMRIRYWASATREFPLYCEDSFSVDRAKDTVTIRQRIEWHSINDDWKTKHLKLAPVSPPLALAAMDKEFPVTFSKPLMNLDLCTPYGPYMAVENVDSFDATFHVLQYVNETEASDPPSATNAHPTVQAALDKLQTTAQEKFRSPDKYDYDHGGLGNFCWAIQGDQWYAKALPYMDEKTRVTAVASLRKYCSMTSR